MDTTIVNPAELRQAGFRALADALGWVNAVRFIRQYDAGEGDYTDERQALLPDWDPATLVEKARDLREGRAKGSS
jgi:hypothetical protein